MSELSQLIAELPELYQPIFNHPSYTNDCSRGCDDRLTEIARVYRALESELGRPLKVLDLGCAQGFFSMSLGKLGATVHGVDYLEQNIAVCRALAQEHSQIQATFEVGRIEDVLHRLADERFDIILGLSVFHHLIYQHGIDAVVLLLNSILELGAVFICEFALNTEPLYWGEAQPDDPRSLLSGADFVHEVSRYETHLADIKRPLYIASNQYWCIGDLLGVIESSTTESHALAGGAHRGARKYFFSQTHVVKVFTINGEYSERGKEEVLQEAKFLQHPPEGFATPALYEAGVSDFEAWLVMERIPGQLLLDLILHHQPYDALLIIRGILQQLTVLEASGLYHDDLRVWNILVDERSHPRIIDFGSISSKPKDGVWPHSVFLAFLIFVKEVMSGKVDQPGFLREVAISPFSLPPPVDAWIAQLWALPPSQWSFDFMLDLFDRGLAGESFAPEDSSLALWMGAMEEAMQNLKQHLNHVEHKVDSRFRENQIELIEKKVNTISEAEFRASGETLSPETHDLNAWIEKSERLEEELCIARNDLRASQENAHLWFMRSNQHEANFVAIQSSNSWRLTRPLRWMHGSFERVLQKSMKGAGRFLTVCIRVAIKNPRLSHVARSVLKRYPLLYQHIRLFAHRRGVLGYNSAHSNLFGGTGEDTSAPQEFIPGYTLSPKGRAIYEEITRLMSQKESQ